jgi:hypothetical protein
MAGQRRAILAAAPFLLRPPPRPTREDAGVMHCMSQNRSHSSTLSYIDRSLLIPFSRLNALSSFSGISNPHPTLSFFLDSGFFYRYWGKHSEESCFQIPYHSLQQRYLKKASSSTLSFGARSRARIIESS